MSKRQSAYLETLLTATAEETSELSTDAPSPPVPDRAYANAERSSGTILLGRESALARVASGEVKQVTQLQLDPARVRVWAGNARHQASLSEVACRDLIEAILAEGGQKVPAIVRRVKDDANFDYEVVAGTRRHWVISWLRANNYPDFTFLAQVHALDDESAFRLSDIENRARKDVSDFERARNYRDALEQHYGGRQVRMAERLRVSKGWLSKMLTVAALPDWVVSAFASPADIHLKLCYPLALRVFQAESETHGDGGAAARLLAARAADLATQQEARRLAGIPQIAASEVVNSLMDAIKTPAEAELLFTADSAHGRRAISVVSANRNGITVRLHSGSGASEAELARLLRDALADLARKGRGLQ